MKMTTRGRYGVHAMYDLALHFADGPRPIKAIAESQSIPEAYLEQLFAALRRGGLIASARGAQGGYRLTRAPEEITVGDVLRCLEGGLGLVECVEEEALCGKACACPSRFVWLRIRDGLNAIVDGITLQDMLDDNARSSPV